MLEGATGQRVSSDDGICMLSETAYRFARTFT
jgi:hypothetical protein